MRTLHIDFETRSRVDIKRCGAGRYIMDPSFKILMTGWAFDNNPIRVECGPRLPEAILYELQRTKEVIFCAQNAFFEYFILLHHLRFGEQKFKCTRAKLAAHGLPQNLDLGAKALNLEILKDPMGKRYINKFCIPQPNGEFLELDDFPEDKKGFMKYCGDDVAVERRIDQMLPDLTPQEQELFNLTLEINARGIPIDQNLAHSADEIGKELQARVNDKVKKLTGGKFYSITQTVRLQEYLNQTYGLQLPNMQGDTIDEILPEVKDPVAKEILTLRAEFGRTSVSKFGKMCEAVCSDGRIRDYLNYHGAHTGRWTSQIVQLHNLPRGEGSDPTTAIEVLKCGSADIFDSLYEYPISTLTTCIRGTILPSKGHLLYVADYNAIEARVLMWLAGQEDAVEMFRKGEDIYLDMACDIYRRDDLTKKDKDERQLGKQTILGAGFGMGPPKFRETCARYSIIIDEEFAKTAIYGYRNKYPMVPQFWEDVEAAAKQTIQTQKPYRVGAMVFHIHRGFLKCRLPSGRDISYYSPSIRERTMKINGKTIKKWSICYYALDSQSKIFGPTWTYGGKLVENIVQAVARDIMASAKLELEKIGFEVLLSTHDEIIAQGGASDKEGQQTDLDIMIGAMCDLPKWAEGCPIAAEGWIGERYRK